MAISAQVIHSGFGQDGIPSGSNSPLFVSGRGWYSDVCEDIGVAQEALSFRAVEHSPRPVPRERTHERVVEQIVLPLKQEILEEMQLVPQARGPD